jgi:hypothetical protein
MKGLLLVAGVIALSSSAARAQASWPVVFKNANVAVALDTANAKRNADGSYLMRTRWDYAKLHALESKRPYLSMTQSALVRCTPVRIKRLTESFYSANGAVVREGAAPNPRDVPYMTWDRLKTGSDGSKAMSAACAALIKRDRKR